MKCSGTLTRKQISLGSVLLLCAELKLAFLGGGTAAQLYILSYATAELTLGICGAPGWRPSKLFFWSLRAVSCSSGQMKALARHLFPHKCLMGNLFEVKWPKPCLTASLIIPLLPFVFSVTGILYGGQNKPGSVTRCWQYILFRLRNYILPLGEIMEKLSLKLVFLN